MRHSDPGTELVVAAGPVRAVRRRWGSTLPATQAPAHERRAQLQVAGFVRSEGNGRMGRCTRKSTTTASSLSAGWAAVAASAEFTPAGSELDASELKTSAAGATLGPARRVHVHVQLPSAAVRPARFLRGWALALRPRLWLGLPVRGARET
jgi:hypothetical protein